MNSPSVYDTRLDFVRRHVGGRSVIDVGSAELVGTVNRAKLARWPHEVIRGLATSVVGVELDGEQAARLRELGYDIRQGNAETFDLGMTADIVFAGELIEHLSNPGAFLDRARAHLAADGLLLLTTPNRYDIHALRPVLRRDRVVRYTKLDAGHVFFFDVASLEELLVRHGFEPIEIGYYAAYGGERQGRMMRGLLKGLKRWRRNLLPGIVVAARPRGQATRGRDSSA